MNSHIFLRVADCPMQFLKNFDPAVMPLGIITLEDVLEGKWILAFAKA